ncbi:hypothetical protein BGW36DRAFT_371112 [Talaromyces proteolyticus]|uniref:Quinate repressor protein n=1 Tax=Talaromyces proteolyticus TaxID=1131652 RepID=A0AAD4L1L3_9EURO|nr:uncharacterized protein BGW36DRAFT_371112 [Talaromyces proteolyticus]KAH8701564.1 hypothetical protein BGW36DRAFT_371112 [Talaromyces proteolyticus]
MSLAVRNDFPTGSSIVLIGARGAGKSSLATIAWSSFAFKHVDIDDIVRLKFGQSLSAHVWQSNAGECGPAELTIIHQIFEKHPRNAVIVWPPGCVGKIAYSVLEQYARYHPIIYVARSATAIQTYLKAPDPDKLMRYLELQNLVYRASSHFEFFNLDEEELESSSASNYDSSMARHPRPLRLKRTEESFVRFLRNILQLGRHNLSRNDALSLPPSRSLRTYLLIVSLTQINSPSFDVKSLDCGADVCQLDINLTEVESYPILELTDRISKAHAILTRFFYGPVIYHLHVPSSLSLNTSQYINMFRHGSRIGVDYLTVDLRLCSKAISELVAHQRSPRFLGVFHDDNPGSEGWSKGERWEMLEKAAAIPGLDGIRLTQVGSHVEDNSAVTAFKVQATRYRIGRKFLVAYNTGPLGRTSRCENEILTPVSAPGFEGYHPELSIQALHNALYASFIYEPRNFYVLGNDMSKCRFPHVQRAAHRFFGFPHTVQTISTSKLPEAKNDMFLGGISIVTPEYKVSLLPLASSLSEHAKHIGAINTLIPIRCRLFEGITVPPPDFWRNRNTQSHSVGLYGENTDWVSISECIRRNLSPANAITKNSTALIAGASGIAYAALYSLLQLGVSNIVIYSFKASDAHKLAIHFREFDERNHTDREGSKTDIRIIDSIQADWYADLKQPTIVISSLPVMEPANTDLDTQFILPIQWMKSTTGGVILDLNYRPLITPILRQAHDQASKGWVTVDGLDNLVIRATTEFEMYTGRQAPRSLTRIEALRNYHDDTYTVT